MQWIDHHKLQGQHAFLGASKPTWMNWDRDTLITRYNNSHAADVGTAIHNLAQQLISARIRITESDIPLIKLTVWRDVPKAYPNGFDVNLILRNLVGYVNDAIGFHMDPEIILYYSDNCFGTTDAIHYDEKNNVLRIHDLKTGTTQVHDEQLLIYCALFCLEYMKDPMKMSFICRFYQNCEPREFCPESKDIKDVMNLIIINDKQINSYLKSAELDN
jgi:hypothetical protein